MERLSCKNLIIGSGPAGLLCAITSNGDNILLEKPSKNFQLAKRILVSGNGRANFFHQDLTSTPSPIHEVLRPYEKEFLQYLKEECQFPYVMEHGLYYPYFNRAESLHNTLIHQLGSNTRIIKGLALRNHEDGLIYLDENGKESLIQYQHLVVATGGRSYDREHFTYELLDSLNVEYEPFSPALCPIKVKEKIPTSFVNQRLKGKVSVYSSKDKIYEEYGEVLFKKDGLSGICIMNSTIAIHEALRKKQDNIQIEIDYREVKDLSTGEITSLEQVSPFAYPQFMKEEVTSDGILRFHFMDFYPFKESQVSFGGVLLSQLDLEDFSFKKKKNIHFIGEILDDNYICGGYNMGHALLEGYVLGKKLS